MNIKLNYGQYVKREIVDAVNDGQYHDVILTTNALSIEKDRHDARYIKTIRDIRIVYGLKSGGCLILGGNLGCSFVQPLGGEFFVKKAYIDEKTDFSRDSAVCDGIFRLCAGGTWNDPGGIGSIPADRRRQKNRNSGDL